jgi:exosome complex RNA-binding protein Csl4
MEKILKYLLKGQVINATMNVSLTTSTDALGVNVYGR